MLSTLSFGDLINPLFLVAFGVALGGLALFVNMIMNVASRIKNMIFLALGTAGAGGVGLANEDIRTSLLAFFGFG